MTAADPRLLPIPRCDAARKAWVRSLRAGSPVGIIDTNGLIRDVTSVTSALITQVVVGRLMFTATRGRSEAGQLGQAGRETWWLVPVTPAVEAANEYKQRLRSAWARLIYIGGHPDILPNNISPSQILAAHDILWPPEVQS